jgi:CubicO group peptidase (beta-lactamase class C family)
VWEGARGLADVASQRAITPSTTFPIGSVSKQFTATAVLLLGQQQLLALSDPVGRWVPGLPDWAGRVTLDHLLHHTSGVPDYMNFLGFAANDRTTQQQALEVLADAVLVGTPGQDFEYSNSNYVLLAEVVRAASGQPLPDFLRERVFEPLDLDMVVDTSARTPTVTDPQAARLYAQSSGWEQTGAYGEQIGDGGIQTTPSELVRWADNYRTGRVGGQQLLDAQIKDAVETRDHVARYGAGIFVTSDGWLFHGGVETGARSAFTVSADRRIAVAVACNRDEHQAIDELSTALLDEWT